MLIDLGPMTPRLLAMDVLGYGRCVRFLSPADLDALLRRHGVTVEVEEFPEPFRDMPEMFLGDHHAFINAQLPREWQNWMKAHILAHRLTDGGNQVVMKKSADWLKDRQERRAEIQAGWIILAGGLDPRFPRSLADLASELGYPPKQFAKWARLVGDELYGVTP